MKSIFALLILGLAFTASARTKVKSQSLGSNKNLITSLSGGESIQVHGDPVVVKYTLDSNSANIPIGNGFSQTVDYNVKVFDSHGAVTVGTGTDADDNGWRFTAPKTGYYSVSAHIMLNTSGGWLEGEIMQYFIYKNDTSFANLSRPWGRTGTGFFQTHGNHLMFLRKGEYIHIEIYQNSGGSIDVYNAEPGSYNFIMIHSVR